MKFFTRVILLLFPINFFIINSIKGQSQFSEGYVITHNNDTIKGYLKLTTTKVGYKKCIMLNDNGNTTAYGPDEIKEYGIFDYAQFRMIDVIPNRDKFYEVVVDGKLSLYEHRGIYFIEKVNTFHEITPNKTTTDKANNQISSRYKYLGLLKVMVNDCGQLAQKVTKKTKDRKTFSQLVKEYNECSGDGYVSFSEKRSWTKASISPQISLIYSKISIEGNDGGNLNERLINTNFDNTIIPAVGFSLSINSPKFSTNISLDLWPYYSYRNYFSSELVESNYIDSYNDVDIRYHSINIPIGIKYQLPFKKLLFQIKTGFDYNMIFNQSIQVIVDDVHTGGIVISSGETHNDIVDNALALYAGISLGYNKGILKPLLLDISYNSFNNLLEFKGSAYSSQMISKNLILSIKYSF